MCNNRLAVRSLTCTLSVLFLVITSGVLSFITVFFLGFLTRRSNVTYLRFKFFSDVHNDRLFLYLSDTKKNTFKNDLHVDSGNFKIFEFSLTLYPFFSLRWQFFWTLAHIVYNRMCPSNKLLQTLIMTSRNLWSWASLMVISKWTKTIM